jgi:type IV secretory pathway TrbD component
MDSSPVHKSMLTEMTTFGVDDWLFVLNLELFLLMAIGLRIYVWAAIALGLHLALMVVTKYQPRVLTVYVKYIRQASRYSSWSCAPLVKGRRPKWLEELAVKP